MAKTGDAQLSLENHKELSQSAEAAVQGAAAFAPEQAEDGPGCSAGNAESGGATTLISPLRLRRHGERPRKRALLIVPPFCSPNYTYPAPAYLARLLKNRGHQVAQADLNLELMLKIFSRAGLQRIFAAVEEKAHNLSVEGQRIFQMRSRYLSTIDPVIRFLQGRDASIAYRICQSGFLPRGKHFDLNRGFEHYDGNGNTLAIHDRAKFVGTLYLYDLGELIREAIFPYFQITLVDRYFDSFVHRCTTFEQMEAELERAPNVIDEMLHECLDEHLAKVDPDLVGVTVPFARNLYWAFRIGRRTKKQRSATRIAMGGGFFNTSMRQQNEPRVFDYVDYITLDDGERPLLDLMEHLQGVRDNHSLKRTWLRDEGGLRYVNGDNEPDIKHEEAGAPDYEGYRIADYFSSLETNNVNQRVRSDGWWNKLTMTHGCYWKKCSFCDIHLSYVGDYDTATAKNLVDKVEQIMAQTGHSGFHFVDEAMPPKVMRDFALEILRRELHISWHGMLRFDKAFTPELCKLLAASGLIAVFGGLEVASDRLLELMKKGTSVEQVAKVAKNFKDAGIKVHGYIMYGFPTQTAQETIDALDVVRQLFKHGLLTSASWAKFAVTPHSPIGRNPADYKIQLLPIEQGAFVEQVIPHLDPTGCDHDRYTAGLMESLRFYGLGYQHDTAVEGWFDFPVPTVSIDRSWIEKILAAHPRVSKIDPTARDRRVLWLGTKPALRLLPVQAGQPLEAELTIHEPAGPFTLVMPMLWAQWLLGVLERVRAGTDAATSLKELEESWELCIAPQPPAVHASRDTTFEQFLKSDIWQSLQDHGLILTQQQKRVIWMGQAPVIKPVTDSAVNIDNEPVADLYLHGEDTGDSSHSPGVVDVESPKLRMPIRWANWLADVLTRSNPDAGKVVDLAELKRSWAAQVHGTEIYRMPTSEKVPFKEFMHTPIFLSIREHGLALL